MKVGILGSGAVGVALAKAFLAEGHVVHLATREPDSVKGEQLKSEVSGATICDFATAAREGELVVLCVNWSGIKEAVDQASADNLKGKVVIDTNNPLGQGSNGVATADDVEGSAGEMIQKWLPESHVVKAYNSVGAALMYKPDFELTPTMFIAGNDESAKKLVAEIITAFGWEPLDTGDITASRELEALSILWINNSMRTNDWHHAYKLL